jgi:cell division protein FtsI (penicillin-binding protein 3)
MAKVTARIALLEVVFVLAVLAVLGRAAQLQIVQRSQWESEAEEQRKLHVVLPARRGGIYDRGGVALAITQEYFHVGIAPNEVEGRSATINAVAKSLELPASRVRRDFAKNPKWIYYHGPFTGVQVQALRKMAGIHLTPEFARHYPAGSLARSVIGGLNADSGNGASGIELALDSILTGVPGEEVVLRDRAGRRYESPSRLVSDPVPGEDVYLTLDAELQEIAEHGLDEAIERLKAVGGDVVFMDPATGELLAIASRRRVDQDLVGNRPSFFTDPFEPGSTAKLFTAAALLSLHRVDSTDEVYGEEGKWVMPVSSRENRTINDAHPTHGNLTLAKAIEVSSNIAMAKFSQRLSATEQYDALRDFGFGSPTGVEFPSEARGRLPTPDQWKAGFNGPSVAMGYSFGVTPVQLAAAYAAVANDGVLLTPSLVREIRSPDGQVLYRHKPEPVRRAVRQEVVRTLREYLAGAVGEGGTGERAQMVNYTLMGKTGTSKRFEGGHYVTGSYTASFAALFPADDPQLVVIVKIDDPKGDYYGGATAAPVTRSMLQEALAARRSAIDRKRLATSEAPVLSDTASSVEPEAETSVVVSWPLSGDSTKAGDRRPVPNVIGANLRKAAVALHRRGFQMALHGSGLVQRTSPVAGDSLSAGGTVTVWAQ